MDLREALKQLADQVKEEIIRRMHSNIGYNPRARKNTLAGSKLEESIKIEPTGENAIVFEIADYYEYVVSGWRRTGNFPGTIHLFIKNIGDWVMEKNIRIGNLSKNQIIWYLYKRMIIEGRQIAPRPFIESGYLNNEDPSKILPFLNDFFDKWADEVFIKITEDIEKHF